MTKQWQDNDKKTPTPNDKTMTSDQKNSQKKISGNIFCSDTEPAGK